MYVCVCVRASFEIDDIEREKRSDVSRFLGGRIIDTVDEASRADKTRGALLRVDRRAFYQLAFTGQNGGAPSLVVG